MNFTVYQQTFDHILSGEMTTAPYSDSHFIEYVKLNHSRQNRWIKKGVLIEEAVAAVEKIQSKQTWVLITEPWCGDASHNVPFIAKLAELNPLITLEIQLRDSEGSEIDSYLTNGGKAIPKLIIRDENKQDLHVWGPRPAEAQALFHKLKEQNLTLEEQKIGLQQWYNENNGLNVQKEIATALKQISY
ncbi:MAG: hypothetical protein RI922_379 [Bacteroidota bacterium]|jgi:hypothetical protein